jgi:tetratricopeptide (TPR) repeat protein
MRKIKIPISIFLFISLSAWILLSWERGIPLSAAAEDNLSSKSKGYTGSKSCRECHEKFYKLWAPSRHGLAMQPFTTDFAKTHLTFQKDEIIIGKYHYRAEIENGFVYETGPDEKNRYPIKHVLGGKNVYYFLTPMKRGRLQTLPVAYDVHKKEWFDTAASGIRHFSDEPANWKEPVYTFNTACYRCHVSQLSTNYDFKTDTYHTVWAEPGINCETCHGPGDEHIRVCKEAPKGQTLKDLRIIRGGRDFTIEQNNASCAPCHAKMRPITNSFVPGDRFFDHYDLVTLEGPDFHPDGRDLGENYTYTLWRMSPCVKSGQLGCLHCHTSSGRYRHKNDPNQSCMPCHEDKVKNSVGHTHHKEDNPGNKCISCHMPMTEFARMRRSDHSMLPPAPAATIAFKSPNACNLCKTDKNAAWADKHVRKWRKRDYQAAILYRAGLIEEARKQDWSRLEEMLAYITSNNRDEVFATSLISLLRACDNPAKWPAVLKAMQDPSPLVRSSAAESFALMPSREAFLALLRATGDDYRLVRVRAAMALAGYPRTSLKKEEFELLDKATEEYINSLRTRPDHWTSHYNYGNYLSSRGNFQGALASFERASGLGPLSIPPLVNTSIVYARIGNNAKAEEALQNALDIDPENPEANFNMGLLKAQQNNPAKAKLYLRIALKSDPKMHEAAYNLGVLLSSESTAEAIESIMKAFELHPSPKYAYTLAFYMRQNGEEKGATEILESAVQKWPIYGEVYMLLGDIYQQQGRMEEAKSLYGEALKQKGLSRRYRALIEAKFRSLKSP